MSYTVVRGDTLGAIARANKTTVAELMKLNPRITNANVIGIGWVLTLPGDKKTTTTTTPADTDPTDDPFSGQKLMNIPGRPEVWHVGKSWFIVYIVPGTEKDPVFMTWSAPSYDDVKAWFGPGKTPVADRTLTAAQYKAMGALSFGSTDEIPPGAENPFAGWAAELRTQAAVQPWIKDDDYQRLMAMALIEGRELTPAEIQSTQWWKTHSAAERAWMITFHGDPSTAQDRLAEGRIQVEQLLQAAGGGQNVDQALINYMADQWTQGHWTQTYLNQQITALTDSYSGIAIDPNVKKLKIATVDQTSGQIDKVRDLLSTWLGPAFGEWDETEIARVAGEIRNDPDAEQAFIEQLKDQRMAMLPEYSDRNTSYAAIANTWRQWWMGQWGQLPDEKDPMFMTVLKNNDMNESAKLLRKEGLARGVGKVGQDLSQAGLQLGNSERRPITLG